MLSFTFLKYFFCAKLTAMLVYSKRDNVHVAVLHKNKYYFTIFTTNLSTNAKLSFKLASVMCRYVTMTTDYVYFSSLFYT